MIARIDTHDDNLDIYVCIDGGGGGGIEDTINVCL